MLLNIMRIDVSFFLPIINDCASELTRNHLNYVSGGSQSQIHGMRIFREQLLGVTFPK